MTQQAAGYEDCDIPLASGTLRVRRWGAADAPAVVCVPGLSANLCGFDRLAERLAGDTLQLVAIDLRGRGRSEVTGAGTYGWRNHARDVLGIADAVGAPSFAIIGQSSGAAIAMTCAQLEPSRVERLVLVDLAGSPDQQSAVPVVASISLDSRSVIELRFGPRVVSAGWEAEAQGAAVPPGDGTLRSAKPASMSTGWWLRRLSAQVTPVVGDVQGAGGVEEVAPDGVRGGGGRSGGACGRAAGRGCRRSR